MMMKGVQAQLGQQMIQNAMEARDLITQKQGNDNIEQIQHDTTQLISNLRVNHSVPVDSHQLSVQLFLMSNEYLLTL